MGSKHYYHEETGTKAKITEYPDHMHLTDLATPQSGRGKGGAKEIMRQALAHADAAGKPTVLHAVPDKDEDEAKLVSFYKGLGFKQSVGGMIRPPGGGGGQLPKQKLSDLHTSELSKRLSDNYSRRPSSVARRFGSNGPTPEQAAAYKAEVNSHQNERSKLQAAHKIALARENAAYYASKK